MLDRMAQLEVNLAELERLREHPSSITRDRWSVSERPQP